MKITFDWLKDHLSTNLKEEKLLDQLTNIGLEVESVENLSVGNELFSPVFVRRCLEYQSDCYDFSYDYTIEIIDSNADIITLNSNQYILVEKNTVSVKDIDCEEEEEEESSEKLLAEDDSDSDYIPSDEEDE